MQVDKPRKLKKIDDEIWKELPNSQGRYAVSNYGRVKSFVYDKINGRLLKPNITNGPYIINLKNNSKFPRNLHKLVALVWCERPSDEYTYVVHLDFNIKNNHCRNLKWVTKEGYLEHCSRLMKAKNAILRKEHRISGTKLTEADIKQLKGMLAKGITQNIIAKMFRISEMQVTRIKRGENWGYVSV